MLRKPLARCLEAVRARGQRGGRPANPLHIPTALARGFAKKLKAQATNFNGGLLFVDCRTAFFSTTRQSLTGQETGQSAAFLSALAEAVYPGAEDRLRFIAQTAGPGLLQCHDVPTPVRRVVCSMPDATWFSFQGVTVIMSSTPAAAQREVCRRYETTGGVHPAGRPRGAVPGAPGGGGPAASYCAASKLG